MIGRADVTVGPSDLVRYRDRVRGFAGRVLLRGVRWSLASTLVALVVTVLLLTDPTRRGVVGIELLIPTGLVLFCMHRLGQIEKRARAGLPLAPVIAVVGCDGSGKSTLSHDLVERLGGDGRVAGRYLGLGSGQLGARIGTLPLLGVAIERRLAAKASQTRDRSRRVPGLPTALVVFGFSLLRLRRFRQVLALRRRGIAVVTDRYPQIEVPGICDGPGLSAARPGSRVVGWLASRERRMYEGMAGYRPDLVLRLNVDAQTAQSRKPDHRSELLLAKVAVTSRLTFHGAPIVDIDATGDYGVVLEEAMRRVEPLVAATPGTHQAA